MLKKLFSLFRKGIVFIFMTPYLKRVRKHSPALYSYLVRRLSLHKFSGMPLTLFIIAMACNFILLLDYTEDIINSKQFIDVDNATANFLYSIRFDFAAQFFYVLTHICNHYFIIIALAVLSVPLIRAKKSYYVSGLLAANGGSALTVLIGKDIFKIARPLEYAYYPITNFSFPSGHAAMAITFYGLLTYLLIRNVKSTRTKALILLGGLILIILIGFSRLYLCVHFVSDVFIGYLLGTLWLLLGISIISWKEYRNKPATRRKL